MWLSKGSPKFHDILARAPMNGLIWKLVWSISSTMWHSHTNLVAIGWMVRGVARALIWTIFRTFQFSFPFLVDESQVQTAGPIWVNNGSNNVVWWQLVPFGGLQSHHFEISRSLTLPRKPRKSGRGQEIPSLNEKWNVTQLSSQTNRYHYEIQQTNRTESGEYR